MSQIETAVPVLQPEPTPNSTHRMSLDEARRIVGQARGSGELHCAARFLLALVDNCGPVGAGNGTCK